MNIATINNILLPVVLFIIYFIFASVVQYNLKNKASVSTSPEASQIPVQDSQQSPETFTYKDAFSAQFDPVPFGAIAPEIVASVQPENIVSVVTQTSKNEAVNSQTTISENSCSIPEIIDRLGKRDIRKLCAPLGIKQKTNGTELTTELMKALVKRKFKETPQMIVEVIGDRFPSLMSTMSQGEQQQYLERKAC